MGSWSAFLAAYLLGGLTFIPLVILTVLAHAHYTFPTRHDTDRPTEEKKSDKDAIVQPEDDTGALEAAADSKTKRDTSVEVAAGYFAVCREYTPMGINAKPIERSTPMGNTTVAAPSPSVYQSMYRSLFERKGAASVNGNAEGSGTSQRPKRAGNVFYVVLRHGHLVLFDDEDQFEVRHVVSLAHHDVSIYSGGDVTPEGELWIKRNAICLSRRVEKKDMGADAQVSKPFYLFSENCSAKEDFYFALLRTQEQTFGDAVGAPKPVQFDVKNIISLVQKLHSTEDNAHTRWLNAMIGRVFLAIHQTKDLETFINEKITKKISRVKTPSFLTNINIQKIDTGEAAPYFTNFKLRDLTVEGDAVAEADVKYTGNFRLEVAATAKLDLGTRMKAREVSLVLALTLKKIEGRVFFKIKPPPSNRVWVSFEKMPKMEMAIEPIVSARQITYAVILRQIENRIKEVFAETLVQPFWDDIPFFKTEHKRWRGGIFAGDDRVVTDGPEEEAAQSGDVEETEKAEVSPDLIAETRPMEKSHSFPTVDSATPQSPTTGLFGRKLTRPATAASPAASSTSIDTKPQPSNAAPSPKTFKNAPEPVVGTDAAHAEMFKPSTSPPDHATNYMAALHSRSQEASTNNPPLSSSPGKSSSLKKTPSQSSASSGHADAEKEDYHDDDEPTPVNSARRNTTSSAETSSLRSGEGVEPSSPASSRAASIKEHAGSIGRNFFNRTATNLSSASVHSGDSASSQKKNTLAAVSNAAAQARQWGWNAIQRQKDARKTSDASSHPVDLSQPMGRGQPLPPPGTPLPRPTNGKTKIGPGPVPVPKRKPVGSSQSDKHEEEQPPLPNRRRRGQSHDEGQDENEEMLVVAAPMDESEPNTPDIYGREEFVGNEQVTSAGNTSHPNSLKNTSTSDTSSTPATAATSQLDTQQSTPKTEPTTTQGSIPDYSLDQPLSPTKTSPPASPSKQAPLAVPQPDEPSVSGTNTPSKTPDGRIIATPAATEDDDDDDDYSGWMDNDSDTEQPKPAALSKATTGDPQSENAAGKENSLRKDDDTPRKENKDEEATAALIQEASY